MSIPSDFATDLIRNQKTLPNDIMATLILAYQKSLQVPEDDTVIDNLFYSPLIDLHDTSIDISDADIDDETFIDHIGSISYRKTIPPTVHSDPLVYNLANISGITFNQPDQNVGSRFNGAGITDGNSYLTINNNPILDITDEIIIACYVYLKIGAPINSVIIHKGFTSFSLIRSAIDQIIFSGALVGMGFTIFHTITSDGWYHIVATAKSGVQSLYINKVLEDSDTLTGSLDTDGFDIGVFAETNGLSNLINGEGISWLSVINGFANQSWVDNDFIGIRAIHDMDELICLPFMQDTIPQPPMTSGLFVSGP